jgi:hypothetical protein
MPAWMPERRSRLSGWHRRTRRSSSHRASTRLRPKCVVWPLEQKKRVVVLSCGQPSSHCCYPPLRDSPRDLRRASRRFFSSSSLEARMDLTAGIKADFLRFPLLSLSAGASSSPRPPGPMLLLRALREDFAGEDEVALGFARAISPSAMFSLPFVTAMVRKVVVGCGDDARDQSVKVNSQARFGKQAKRSVHTTLAVSPRCRCAGTCHLPLRSDCIHAASFVLKWRMTHGRALTYRSSLSLVH